MNAARLYFSPTRCSHPNPLVFGGMLLSVSFHNLRTWFLSKEEALARWTGTSSLELSYGTGWSDSC